MTKSKPDKPETAEAGPYVPTDAEVAALKLNDARRGKRVPQLRLAVKFARGNHEITVEHPDVATGEGLFNEALGLSNSNAACYVSELLASLCLVEGKVSQSMIDRTLGLVQELAPRDAAEVMLASQMVAVHSLAMATAAGLAGALSTEVRDQKVNQITKLNRTFTGQIETLKRYRSKGEQKVVVKHVHVHEGGQAIVGNVTQGVGGEKETGGQPHVRSISEREAMHGAVETDWRTVPGAGGEGLDGVPVSRSAGRPEIRAVK
jgi:hypothetical protein